MNRHFAPRLHLPSKKLRHRSTPNPRAPSCLDSCFAWGTSGCFFFTGGRKLFTSARLDGLAPAISKEKGSPVKVSLLAARCKSPTFLAFSLNTFRLHRAARRSRTSIIISWDRLLYPAVICSSYKRSHHWLMKTTPAADSSTVYPTEVINSQTHSTKCSEGGSYSPPQYSNSFITASMILMEMRERRKRCPMSFMLARNRFLRAITWRASSSALLAIATISGVGSTVFGSASYSACTVCSSRRVKEWGLLPSSPGNSG
mmetsp:Transcript_42441/g.111822  ORF Transcript_42441/g.111822 Transcript_42441/m.111822 type:complete len:258 (+) Transcript_42441:672-1445(+)